MVSLASLSGRVTLTPGSPGTRLHLGAAPGRSARAAVATPSRPWPSSPDNKLVLSLPKSKQSLVKLHKRHGHVRLLCTGSSGAGQEDVPDEVVEELKEDALMWTAQHGLVMGMTGPNPNALIHAPIALLPTPFPRQAYDQGFDLGLLCNKLMDAVSRDEDYLRETLKQVCEYDAFTARLMELFEATREEARKYDTSLGLLRNDYMLDEPSGRLLQVEMNTIASSFGCLSTLTSRLHRYLVEKAGLQEQCPLEQLPENEAMEVLAEALAAGVREGGGEGAALLMVVQPGERNAFDQQWLALTLWNKHRIRTIRRSLKQVAEQGSVGAGGALRAGGRAGGSAYLRAGYTPDDYPSEEEWAGRAVLERSAAVKCPTAALHLAGTKKVQQDLARPGVLERFLAPEEAAAMRRSFAGLWGLGPEDEGVEEAIAAACGDPDAFVLKPQREGGGNNLYGPDVKARLQGPREGLEALILMQRIRPPVNRTLVMRSGEASTIPTLSELGMYSVFLRRGSEFLLDQRAGHLLRTKSAESDEGGVAAGYSVIDSPSLT